MVGLMFVSQLVLHQAMRWRSKKQKQTNEEETQDKMETIEMIRLNVIQADSRKFTRKYNIVM